MGQGGEVRGHQSGVIRATSQTFRNAENVGSWHLRHSNIVDRLPLSGSVADFTKLVAEETEKWAKVVKFAGLKAE